MFTQDLLPRTNIAEDDKALTVSLEMPGLEQKDIDVHVENDHLMVRAERKSQVEDSGAKWHRVEQRYGSLSRTIALPKGVQADAIDAGTAFFQWNAQTVLDMPPGTYSGAAPDLGKFETQGQVAARP